MKQPLFIFILILLLNLLFNQIILGQSDTLLSIENPKKEKIFKVVEEQAFLPTLPGCEVIPDSINEVFCFQKILMEHFYKNLKYPELAKGIIFEKTVIIKINFNREDKTYCINLIRDIGYGTGKATLESVNLSLQKLLEDYKPCKNKWNPMKSRGQPVVPAWTFPIKFELQNKD